MVSQTDFLQIYPLRVKLLMNTKPMEPIQKTSSWPTIIRNLYLYVVAVVALFMMVFSTVDIISIALKTWVFTKADYVYVYPASPVPCEAGIKGGCLSPEDQKKNVAEQKQAQEDQRASQKQNDIVRNISMLIVAIPLFIFHWTIIRRDRKS